MGHQHHGHRIGVQWHRADQPRLQLGGGDRPALEVHQNVVKAGRLGDQFQQIVRIVIGPQGDGPGRLAGGIVALTDTQGLAQHSDHPGQQLDPGRQVLPQHCPEGGLHPGRQLQPQLPP